MIKPIFLSHGAPTRAIEEDQYTNFLKTYAKNLKPKAVVVFSAHWETKEMEITYTNDELPIIYDFYGFPEELYQVKYPAKGSTEVADQVIKLFEHEQLPITKNQQRGLDHGSWTLLKWMFPNHDVPIVQVSINPFLKNNQYLEIGAAIKSLSNQDILIVGSGQVFHNFNYLNPYTNEPIEQALNFDAFLIEAITNENDNDLINYNINNHDAAVAVPRAEHFVPLLILYGTKQNKPNVIHQSFDFGSFSNLSFEF